jgi:hypothetical protein
LVGRTTCQQNIQHHSQRVDIAGSGDRCAFHLFRAGISRSQDSKKGQRGLTLSDISASFQNLGDAEVKQLWDTLCGHQNVAGFYVAVDEQVLMRVLHGRTNLNEEFQPLGNRKLVGVAIFVDRQAFDQVHHKVGHTILRRAAIEQPSDVWMIEAGQDLPLILETIDDKVRVLTRADQLDCDLLLVLVVCAEGSVDLAHPANADLPHDLIGADTSAEEWVRLNL